MGMKLQIFTIKNFQSGNILRKKYLDIFMII